MTSPGKVIIMLAAAVATAAGLSCSETEIEGAATFSVTGQSAFRLPAGHPGFVQGSTLVIPRESEPPAVRVANCFAGVPREGDAGIGSAVGYSQDYIGYAVLPVNVNLGARVLDSYTVRVSVPHHSVSLGRVTGSNPLLCTDDCSDRCDPVCLEQPQLYPRRFQCATGFEQDPAQVSYGATWVTVHAEDIDASPVTGTVNLCNVRVDIKDALPSSGVILSFQVQAMTDHSANQVPANPLSGIVIKNYKLE